jgi:hypothetical protein
VREKLHSISNWVQAGAAVAGRVPLRRGGLTGFRNLLGAKFYHFVDEIFLLVINLLVTNYYPLLFPLYYH